MPVTDETLASLPYFYRLTVEQRRALSQVLVERRYGAGAVIFEEGARGAACAFITGGTVHAEIDAGAGSPRRRINSMGAGEIFGEVALLDGGPRSATCVAGGDGAIIALLSRDDFTLLFEAGNPFAFSMVRLVTRQLTRRMRHAADVWSEAVQASAESAGR